MGRLLVLILVAVGCNSSTAGSAAGSGTTCIQDGSTFTCGDQAYPACTDQQMGGRCNPDASVECMSCFQGAGAYCYCDNARGALMDGAPFWVCPGRSIPANDRRRRHPRLTRRDPPRPVGASISEGGVFKSGHHPRIAPRRAGDL